MDVVGKTPKAIRNHFTTRARRESQLKRGTIRTGIIDLTLRISAILSFLNISGTLGISPSTLHIFPSTLDKNPSSIMSEIVDMIIDEAGEVPETYHLIAITSS